MTKDIRVPDIGDFKNVPVIEVHVKPGQQIKAEDPIVTLESDKATMEVPSPEGGTVGEVKVKVGDKVSMGSALISLSPLSRGEGQGEGRLRAMRRGVALHPDPLPMPSGMGRERMRGT